MSLNILLRIRNELVRRLNISSAAFYVDFYDRLATHWEEQRALQDEINWVEEEIKRRKVHVQH